MGGKGKAPKAPDMSELVRATEESARIWQAQAMKELEWAKEQNTQNQQILERVLGVQLPMLEEQFRQATADRDRFERVFQPLEDSLAREAMEYDTPERREREAARMMADVRTSFEAQRQNAEQALQDYGIDPSQLRSTAIDRGIRAQEAAMTAFAGNMGRESTEQTGRALRGEAINIGRGYPGQVAQSQALLNQTGAGALQGGWGNTQSGVVANQGALGAGQMAMRGFGQAGDITNMGYQNRLAQWQANAGADAAMWSGIGQLGGAALGAYGMYNFGKGAEDGGHVPYDMSSPGPSDVHPVLLADDEYVIPADVVKRKGTEFFDKLLEKYKEGGEYEQKKRRALGGVT